MPLCWRCRITAKCGALLVALGSGLFLPAAWCDATYSVQQALVDALARDARIRAAEERLSESREELQKVRGLNRPNVRLNGHYGYSYDESEARFVTIYEGESSRFGVDASQNLWSFGRIPAQRRKAYAQINYAQANLDETRNMVADEVVKAFAEKLWRDRILQKRQDFENHAKEAGQLVNKLLKAGQATRVELQKVRVSLHQARVERIGAQVKAEEAQTRLAWLTDAQWQQLDAQSLTALWQSIPASMRQASTMAVEQSPTLLMATSRLREAEADLDVSKAELRPDLSAELSWSSGNTDDLNSDSSAALLNLRVPLYQGGILRAERRQAAHAAAAARNEVDAAKEKLQREVRLNWQLLQSFTQAQADLQLAVEYAQETISLVEQRLQAGRATLADKLEAEQSLINIRVDLLENGIKYNAARVNLLRILNMLTPPAPL